MSDVVACPSCARPLNVPAHVLGATVCCPSCGNSFTAPVRPPKSMQTAAQGEEVSARMGFADTAKLPRPPMKEEEQSSGEPRNPFIQPTAALTPADAAAWKRVRRGILFLPLAWLALAACFLSFQGIENLVLRQTRFGLSLPPPTYCDFDLIVLILCLAPPVAHVILTFRGEIDCLGVPRGNARSWAVVGFCLTVGLFLIAAVLFFMEAAWASCLHCWFMAVPTDDPAARYTRGYASQTDVEVVMVLIVWAVPLVLARLVAFLLFLRAVAKEVGASRQLVRSVSILAAAVALAPVAGPLLLFGIVAALNYLQPRGGSPMLIHWDETAFYCFIFVPPALLIWIFASLMLVRGAVAAYRSGRPGLF